MIFIRADVSIGDVHVRHEFISIAHWFEAMIGNPKCKRTCLLMKGISLEFRRGFWFFSKSRIASSLAILLTLLSIPGFSDARDMPLGEIMDLPPIPVDQLLNKFLERDAAPSMAASIHGAPLKKPKVLRVGKDYQISDLLSQEPVLLGSWLESLGNRQQMPEEQQLVAEMSQASHHEEASEVSAVKQNKLGNSTSQQVLIRVQGEEKAVASKFLKIEQPATAAAMLDVAEHLEPDWPVKSQDATSEFLSSYLAGIKGSKDLIAPEKESHKQLAVIFSNGQAEIDPKEISGSVGDIFTLVFKGKEQLDDAKLFVRNRKLLNWDAQKRELHAIKEGRTEVFFSAGDQMLIIPVDIGARSENQLLSDLTPPTNITGFESLEAIFSKQLSQQNARISGDLNQPESPDIPLFTPITLDGGKWKIKQRKSFSPYFVNRIPVKYENIRFKFVNEKSVFEHAGKITFKIIGTEYSEEIEDGMGSYFKVPYGSRFFINVSDNYKHFAPSMVEVYVREAKENKQTIPIKLMENTLLENLRRIHEVEYNPYHASLCGVALGRDGKPLAGVHAYARYGTNSGSDAIYSSEIGFLRDAKATGPDGRFCFLDIIFPDRDEETYFNEGTVALEFSIGDEYIGSVALNLFTGKHLDQNFHIFDQLNLDTRIASLPAAKDIDFLTPNNSDNRSLVDMVNLLAINDEFFFRQIDFGYLTSVKPQNFHNGRSCYMNESPEYEYAYYCYDQKQNDDGEHVTSLIPNGFLDTISQKYNMPFLEPTLGHVFVEHGTMLGRERDSDIVVVELIDSFGNRVKNGVHISGKPTTRAVFLNLDPGSYTVMIKTSQGFWLDLDTVTVFSDTTSYLRTGSPIRYTSGQFAASLDQ